MLSCKVSFPFSGCFKRLISTGKECKREGSIFNSAEFKRGKQVTTFDSYAKPVIDKVLVVKEEWAISPSDIFHHHFTLHVFKKSRITKVKEEIILASF